jgi:calmodulin
MGPRKKDKQDGAALVGIVKGGKSQIAQGDQVPRNAKGGVEVSIEEIEGAFAFLDVEGKGKVTIGNLKKRLTSFFPDLTTRDFKYLMDNKKELVMEDLVSILQNNEIKEFDPVAEAFRSYDPEGKGFISKDKLADIFATFGFGELSGDELSLLVKAADVDSDGIVSLSDFRNMINPPKIDDNTSKGGSVNQATDAGDVITVASTDPEPAAES